MVGPPQSFILKGKRSKRAVTVLQNISVLDRLQNLKGAKDDLNLVQFFITNPSSSFCIVLLIEIQMSKES